MQPITQSDMMIFTTDDEQVELSVKLEDETVWLNRQQMALLFDRDIKTIGKHVNNVFKEGELDKKVVVAKFATTTQHGAIKGKTQQKEVEFYNLDVIISVGYRVKSQKGTQFRIWATKRLKDYLIKGYAINQKRLAENQQQFLKTLEDLKALTHDNPKVETTEILSLIQSFADTWFTLDSYDKQEFPERGDTVSIKTSAEELQTDLQLLKFELINKGEATELFAQEKKQGLLAGIFGNVFQSIFGQDAYPTLEEKAAHLLYFIIKNHPFTDGNKRSGAFAFIWLLQKYGYDFADKINPQTLTTLTILIAESDPNDKEKMIGVVKLLLNPTGI
ncbi:virulence protein RhuM/Fic/DOC family protein [Psychrobacter sp. HD31]|uniref:RhuM family protein n=1 Tax=Psychrobacter sp. HD31 TaxID=3112003 RepID=UPI003DA67185